MVLAFACVLKSHFGCKNKLDEKKMLYNEVKKVIKLDAEREITISTGKYAKQADGSVIVQQGDTMLLATVVAAKDAKDDCDFIGFCGLGGGW